MYPLGNNLMDFVADVRKCCREFPDLPSDSDVDTRTVIIHDVDGSGRAALFTMVLHLTDQVEDGGPFVDVYSAVQIMMSRRKGLLTDVNDYNYVYKVLWSVLQHVKQINAETLNSNVVPI